MHNLTKIKLFRALLWIIYPFTLILVYPIALSRRKKASGLFFFFDRYSIGGAQRLYFEILESVDDISKTVYFTRKSPDDKFKTSFFQFPATSCSDIHKWCDNLLFRVFSVHYYAFFLNRHSNATVLGSNSTFFYDMLPFLSKKIRKMELLHNFSYGNKGMEFFGLANHKYLTTRLVYDNFTWQNILDQYRKYKVEPIYDDRVMMIEYGVDIPQRVTKQPVPPLKIFYAGRGGAQKRIWLLNSIARFFIAQKDNVQFIFAGSMGSELSDEVKAAYTVYNEIGERSFMNELFANAHAIILTSAFEGFPVVIKEGMANGCVPIVTALPGNKSHLKHGVNALLIEDINDEHKVVSNAIDLINQLLSNTGLLQQLSVNAYDYAAKNFGNQEFRTAYRKLLTSENVHNQRAV